ncbi:MAG: sterol desaturase family protein [Leptolyngbyaceae cyanobacterium]
MVQSLLAAGLLLLLGDFVSTFVYHVPEHVFGKFHNAVHHSPNRSFVRYAIRHRKPIALIDGFLSAAPYLIFIPVLWHISPWGIALGLILAEGHVIWRHQFQPQYRTPQWLQILCKMMGITTPERHWQHHQNGNKAFGDIFSFYGWPAAVWLRELRRLKQWWSQRQLSNS